MAEPKQPDRKDPRADEDVVDRGDDVVGREGDEAFEDADDLEDEAIDDDEQLDADERLTAEVGSEGGSPGETVVTREREGDAPVRGGSEGSETAGSQGRRERTVERVGEQDQPIRRNP